MRKLGFASVALWLFVSQQDLFGQTALYSLPGFNDGYWYGYDVGNGVQVGYGFGAGVALSPQQLMASTQGPYTEPLYQGVLAPPEFQPDLSWISPAKAPVKKSKPHAHAKKAK